MKIILVIDNHPDIRELITWELRNLSSAPS